MPIPSEAVKVRFGVGEMGCTGKYDANCE